MSLPAIVTATQRGISEPIRRMPDEQATAAISKAIALFCEAFGIDKPLPGGFAIAVSMVKNRFAMLGAGEIITAAQLAASGELQVEVKFYGRFSLQVFGDILTAYLEQRNVVHAAILKKQEDAKQAEAKARHDAERKAQYDANFPDMLKAYTGTMQDIPTHWHDTALRLGLIQYTDEQKRDAWIRAAEHARTELERRVNDEDNIYSAKAIMKRLEANDYEGLRIVYAKKILLWENIR